MGVEYIERIEFNASNNVLFPPQSWEFEESRSFSGIDPKHIISYYPNGDVCSRYEDDVWRLTYSLSERLWLPVNFTLITDGEDYEIVKWMMLIVIYFSRGKAGTIKAPGTLSEYYHKAIRSIYEYAAKNDLTFRQLLGRKQMMKRYITTVVKKNKSIARVNHSFLIFLKGLDENISRVHYAFDSGHSEILRKYADENRDSYKQSECIPPRILQNAVQMRWEHIDRVESVQQQLIKLIERLMNNPFNYYSNYNEAIMKAKEAGVEHYLSFGELIADLELESFCKRYKINSRDTLKNYLSRLGRTSRHLIYSYTGMRNDEGNLLLVGCYRHKSVGSYPVIIGVEKKNGIPKEHPFVTVKEIKRVIDLNETITATIAKYIHFDEVDLPLLINPQWILGGKVKFLEANSSPASLELPLDESRLLITLEDKKLTLEATEPERDWDLDENYQVGKAWKFNWHQYRRSIAVYALNSGLVSLSALSKQFRHFFEATTAHYGNGHFVAQPLEGTDSKYHVKYEMDEQRAYYDSLAMHRDMLFNLERPESGFNPQQNAIESLDPENLILSLEEPKTLAKKIRSGEKLYTNTAIGSCTSLKPCDGHIMLFFAGCVDCHDAIHNDDKLGHTIEKYQSFKVELEEYMPGSIELRDVEIDIVALVKLQRQRQGIKQ